MYIDLNDYEIMQILRDGSTNQRNFVNKVDSLKIDYFKLFEVLEDYQEYFNTQIDIRSLLNGGALYIATDKDYHCLDDFVYAVENFYSYELKEGVFLIIE